MKIVETLIVITVLTILFSISLPAFSNFSAQLSLDTSAKALLSELRNLQSQAVSQHKTLSLNLSNLKLPSGIKFKKVSNISFASSGFTPPSGSGTLILQNHFGHLRKIVVSSAGRVRLE